MKAIRMLGTPSATIADLTRDSTLAVTRCSHCGNECPAHVSGTSAISNTSQHATAVRPETSGRLSFCCNGCATVYNVLRTAGLSGYYAVRGKLEEEDSPACPIYESFREFDNDSFRRRYVRSTSRATEEVELFLEGIHCAACVWLIEKLPSTLPGCVAATLELGKARARLEWNPKETSLSTIARFLASLGYRPHAFRSQEATLAAAREERSLLMKIGISAAVATNIMFMAIALYAGERRDMDAGTIQLLRWLTLVVYLPSLFLCAPTFFSGAVASLKKGVPHMDLPLSVGIVVGSSASAYRVGVGSGDLYFDSLAALICLLLVARYLQKRSYRLANDAASLLGTLTPSSARVVDGNSSRMVPVEALLPGMTVEIRANEPIPADGSVCAGWSSVNCSLLTGESTPVKVEVGVAVWAGTLNLQSPIIVLLTSTGEETRVGRLTRLMEETRQRRAPIIQLTDHLTRYFAGSVLLLAVIAASVWSVYSWQAAIENVIALLVVTCPCALGMATPVALTVALGRAAKQGILVKGTDCLERLAGIRMVFLDKTGTLTEGKMMLRFWRGEETNRQLLRSLEHISCHPIARAIEAKDGGMPLLPIDEAVEVAGCGVRGKWESRIAIAGSRRYLESQGIELEPDWTASFDLVLAQHLTPVLVALDGRIVGLAGVGDGLRSDSHAAIRQLEALGITVGILSGDHPVIAEALGRALQLDARYVHGGLSPEEKVRIVDRAAKTSSVVMVGDGVNDAAALSAATVGISVHGSAEASLAAADIFLTRPGIIPVVEAIAAGRRAMYVVRRNLFLSILYNLAGASLAVAGFMSPLLAAVLMPFSSLTVVISSLVGRRSSAPAAERV